MLKLSSNTHVAVLMGGWSPERDVSLVSGAQCANALRALGYQVSEVDADRNLHEQLSALKPDVCFNALHGVGGEDGEVQGLLEVLQIPYTHSGVRASSLAMGQTFVETSVRPAWPASGRKPAGRKQQSNRPPDDPALCGEAAQSRLQRRG